MEKYKGIALDTRSNKEIKKDWNAKDLVSGYIKEPVFKTINNINEIPLYFRRDQDGSGSCVAQSLAKLIEVILLKKRGIHFKFSATPIYQKRSNKPEAGMIGQNAMDIVVKFFTCLEEMVKSENMNDSMMDSLPVDVNQLLSFTATFFKENNISFSYFVDNSPTFNEMAQYIENEGGAIAFISSDYQNWCKDRPTNIDNKRTIGHSTCYHELINMNGEDLIVLDESWGKYSTSEMGDRGQRLMDKATFEGTAFFVGVLVLHEYKENKVDYSKYINLPVMQYKDNKPQVQDLQQMLLEYGSFPSNIGKDNNFGNQTKKALLKWQLENLSTSKTLLNLWGGRYFGSASIKKIKELSNTNMKTQIPSALQSSDGSGNLSTTIKGLLVLLAPVIISFLASKNILITQDTLISSFDVIITVIGSLVTAYGLLKKVYYNFK